MLGKLLSMLLLIFILAVAVNAVPVYKPVPYRGKIQMTTITPEAINGFYSTENSSTINITSDRNGLSITVLDTGEPLLVIPKPGDRGKSVAIAVGC